MAYHDEYNSVSCSMAKIALGSLSDYHATFIARTKPQKQSTRAMDTGSIAHAVLLEGAKFDKLVAVYPESCLKKDGAINPKPANEWKASQDAEYFQKVADADRTQAIIEAVRVSHVGAWIANPLTVAEKPIYWRDNRHGIERRCKPDFLSIASESVYPFDLKITPFWTPEAFRKQIRGQSYWLQQPFYLDGIAAEYPDHEIAPFRFVTVNPEPPHQVAVHKLSRSSSDEAAGRCDDLLEKLSAAYRTNTWVDACQLVENEIELSKWDYE